MIDTTEMARRVATLETLLAARHGCDRGPLAARVQAAGRLLPRGVRRDIYLVIQAAAAAGHPRLRLGFDAAKVSEAYGRAEAHLRAINVADRRKGRVLSVLGSMAFNLLAVFVLLVVVLVWRSFV